MMKVCLWCGTTFLTTRNDKVYCSEDCRKMSALQRARNTAREKREKEKAERKPDVSSCEQCGKEFVRARCNQRFCCERCQIRWNAELKKKQKEEPKKEESLLLVLDETAPVETVRGDVDGPEDMRGHRISATEPRIVPRPTCRLEKDVLEARRAGAKSYGYYKAFRLLGW